MWPGDWKSACCCPDLEQDKKMDGWMDVYFYFFIPITGIADEDKCSSLDKLLDIHQIHQVFDPDICSLPHEIST